MSDLQMDSRHGTASRDIPVNQTEALLRNLSRLAEERNQRDDSMDMPDRASTLSEFLAVCARSLLTTQPGPRGEQYSEQLYHARDVFVQAGLEALAARQREDGNGWLQVGIRPQEDSRARGELCRQVSGLAKRLLSDSVIDDFFFMNKPPGMRLRFRPAATANSGDLADVLRAEVMRWRAEGLIDHVEPGVYEPETQLFGGAQSMRFVHALFTVDSLIWLDYHSCGTVEREAVSPAWLVSLATLRTVFAGLDITAWEDIGVWDSIRQIAGRRLGENKISLPIYAQVAGEIRDVWSRGQGIMEDLHPAVKAIVADYDSALLTGAARWRSGYFCQQGASLGPRAAAAFYVIFHWNRAALSHTEQALLAESLSERIYDDVRG
jgi:thiopeptide-type bacteriocin biosynthesis protein